MCCVGNLHKIGAFSQSWLAHALQLFALFFEARAQALETGKPIFLYSTKTY